MYFCMMLKRQKELEQAAQVDALTGILNKQSTETAIDGWLQEAHQKKQVFLMLDVDKFKEINDRYGHAAGDAALRQVGQTLVRLFRENDIVGRIGGDEFVILMKEVNSIRDAELKAEALCVLFRSLHPEGCPDEVHLSCSIGLVEVPERRIFLYGAVSEGGPGALRSEAERKELLGASRDERYRREEGKRGFLKWRRSGRHWHSASRN